MEFKRALLDTTKWRLWELCTTEGPHTYEQGNSLVAALHFASVDDCSAFDELLCAWRTGDESRRRNALGSIATLLGVPWDGVDVGSSSSSSSGSMVRQGENKVQATCSHWTDEQEFELDFEGRIAEASLVGVVQYVAGNQHSADDASALILTLPTWCPSMEHLLQLLALRFQTNSEASSRARILNFADCWIRLFPQDFSQSMRDVSETVFGISVPAKPRLMLSKWDHFASHLGQQAVVYFTWFAPTKGLPRDLIRKMAFLIWDADAWHSCEVFQDRKWWKTKHLHQKFSTLKQMSQWPLAYTENELADAIYEKSLEIFLSIDVRSLTDPSSVSRSIAWFNAMRCGFAFGCISPKKESDTACVAQRTLRVMELLVQRRDFQSSTAIWAAIQSASCHRLRPVKALAQESLEFNNLFTPAKGWSALRTVHQEIGTLPYLGLYLSDLSFIDEGFSHRVSRAGFYNMKKLRAFGKLRSHLYSKQCELQRLWAKRKHLDIFDEIVAIIQAAGLQQDQHVYQLSLIKQPHC